jgi:hypothetical protein
MLSLLIGFTLVSANTSVGSYPPIRPLGPIHQAQAIGSGVRYYLSMAESGRYIVLYIYSPTDTYTVCPNKFDIPACVWVNIRYDTSSPPSCIPHHTKLPTNARVQASASEIVDCVMQALRHLVSSCVSAVSIRPSWQT